MAHGIEGTVILHFLRKVEMPEQFFEIAIDGATLQTRWGKPGSKAVSAEKVFDDEEGACAAAADKLAEKLADGFEETALDESPQPSPHKKRRIDAPVEWYDPLT